MADNDNSVLEDIIGGIVLFLISVSIPALVVDMLGMEAEYQQVFESLRSYPIWVKIAFLVLYCLAGFIVFVIALSVTYYTALYIFLFFKTIVLWIFDAAEALAVSILEIFRALLNGMTGIVAAALIASVRPATNFLSQCYQNTLRNMKLLELYWRYGHEEFESFKNFRIHMNSEDENDDDGNDQEEEPPVQADPYLDALALFGFEPEENFTCDDLKKRYCVLIGKVHPDRFPTKIIAQQINCAHTVIKQKRRWS